MAIDDCQYSFNELANKVMPVRMKDLRYRMQEPIAMAEFGATGVGTSGILTKLGLKKDFKGCYVLIDRGRSIYVGISQNVIQRLQQHVKGKTHYDASLAYRMAAANNPHSTTRSGAMHNDAFKDSFMRSKDYIRTLAVAYIEITNPVELYLFELYCTMELNTDQWNTFKTH